LRDPALSADTRFHRSLIAAPYNRLTQRTNIKEQAVLRFIGDLARDNKAAAAIEYALIALLIGLAAIGSMQKVGRRLSKTFVTISRDLR
jgi:Flp pilus assembly pilin Flp